MATNKKILLKGIRVLALSLPLLFIGPVVINSAFKNKENPLYPYVLGLGIIICGFSIFLIFKGINTLIKSLFDGDRS
ncbi:DUF6095 family protein [Flavobacterium sp. NRK F10]|uniref:Uncharacterized protein n=1 Tax=Flavobacterium sediminis TaxID=2201181 RepID=A0A2U8QWS3_9FLAO|nr:MULTISPECIES: DUF6095 family protein [Flavobacterium]AWM14491.1 hypothetical protein DI487_11910 [Flavobacterium sediminis]MCO6175721.1 DUF6095 family protein [Flavobacterium sp. NRK F10]